MNCNLCQGTAEPFFAGRHGEYFRCSGCHGISLSPEYFPDARTEKERYEKHHNDVNDVRYQRFVSPVVKEILSAHGRDHCGLDFGCGPGPVIHFLLRQQGFSVEKYDPFFFDDRSVLAGRYDYIVCCEVIEHFHHPAEEFSRLFSLLNPRGKLYCMTEVYEDHIDFGKWYYKNDPTHVFFYHPDTFKFIDEHYRLEGYRLDGRVVVFEQAQW